MFGSGEVECHASRSGYGSADGLGRHSHSKLWKEVVELFPNKGRSLGVNQFRLVLLGPVGSGKSSFFNTITSVMRGFVSHKAPSGITGDQPITTMFCEYDMTSPVTGKPMGWKVLDTVGLQTVGGIAISDLLHIIDGHVPNRWQFSGENHIQSATPGYITSPSVSQEAHCVGLVIDAPRVHSMPCEMWDKLNVLQSTLSSRGVPVAIILTKIDEACGHVRESSAQVFHSQVLQDIVCRINLRIPGVPLNRILPVKNYESESNINECINILTLLAVRQMLRLAQSHLEDRFYQTYYSRTSLVSKISNCFASLKFWVIVLLIATGIGTACYFEWIKNTIIFRENTMMILITIKGGLCFVFGWLFDPDSELEDHEVNLDGYW